MITFNDVSKLYQPNIVALKDITFEVGGGEFLFLVGHSGAGKSTIIRLLIRQEVPSRGDILFEDIDITQLENGQIPQYRQGIGVVFQDYKLLENKTIRENLEFALEITDKEDNEISETVDSLLEITKLQDRQELFPAQLSGGEKQRAGIARALANDPKLLIADEPTGNLDPDTAMEIFEIFEKVNSWGTTIMIATHDKDMVDMLKKRVIRLEGGELVSDEEGTYESSRKATKKQPRKTKPQPTTEARLDGKTDIKTLKLPKKIHKALRKNGIETISDILDLSEEELNNIKGIGEKNADLILAKIAEFIEKNAK